MEIKQFTWGIVDSNSWMVLDEKDGLLIDAVDNPQLYKFIKNLDSLTIILTHSHFDHIVGLEHIREIYPKALVYATEQCSRNIGDRYKNMSASANVFMTFYRKEPFIGNIESFTCSPADITFDKTLVFNWKGHYIKLESFYGHSNDSLTISIDNRFLFSGDTVLHTPTITRFPGGNTEKFWKNDIPKLNNIDIEQVFPGHGPIGYLKELLANNIEPEKYRRI